MADRALTASAVHDVLLSKWPGRFEHGQLGDHISLGAAGLELDSIEVVELLLEFGGRFDVVAADALLEAGPITIGQLIDHVARS